MAESSTVGSGSAPGVVVVGGGVLGVSTAAQLARSGAAVTLVTDGSLASGASGRSLSWLNSAGRGPTPYHQLRMAGLDRYRTLAAQHPELPWLRFDGGLRWRGPEAAADLRHDHAQELDAGYDSVLVDRTEVRWRFPAVDADRVPDAGALWNPGEGWVDLAALVAHLAADLVTAGGRLVTGAGLARVVVGAGRVRGVHTERAGDLAADLVLLATGADVPRAAAELGVPIPDATPVALLVRTEPVETGLRVVLNTPRAAVRPAPDGGLSVDADWTAASITRSADGGYGVPDAVVAELLDEASALLAGHPRLTAASLGIGPKPVPADGEPVLGRLGDVGGLFVAFSHSGATLGLIAGELLARQMLTGEQPSLLAPFTAGRFG